MTFCKVAWCYEVGRASWETCVVMVLLSANLLLQSHHCWLPLTPPPHFHPPNSNIKFSERMFEIKCYLACSRLFFSTWSGGVWASSSWRVIMYLGIWAISHLPISNICYAPGALGRWGISRGFALCKQVSSRGGRGVRQTFFRWLWIVKSRQRWTYEGFCLHSVRTWGKISRSEEDWDVRGV